MPAGQHVHQEQTLMHAFRQASHDITNDDESAASILQSVKEQEAQFEQLTRELEAERQSVANQLEKCKLGSETASMSSISSTDDSFHWRPTQQHHHLENESDTESKMSGSQLVDSCLLVNRKVDTTINKKVYRTERIESNPGMLSRRVLQDKGIDMQYHPPTTSVNGPNAGDRYSPTASQLSVDGQHQLVSRNTSQKTTQQVTTVTKVYTTRTIHVPGAPGEPERVEYVYSTTIPTAGNEYISYNPPPEPQSYSPNPHSPGGEQLTRTVRTEYVTYSPSEDGESYGRYPNYAYPPEQEPPRPLQEYGTYPYPRSPVNEVTRTTRTEYNYSPLPGIGQDIPQDYSNYSSLPRSTAGSDRTYPTYITSVPRSFEHPPTPPSPVGQGSASPPPARSPAPQTPGSQARPDSRSYGTPPYKRSGCEEMDGPYADEGPYGRPPYHGDPIRGPYRLTPSPGAGSDRFGPPGYRSPSYPTAPVPSPYGAAPRAVFDEDMPHMDDPRQRVPPSLHEPPLHSEYDPQRRSPSIDSETRDTRWRDPDLPEVIEFLTHPNNIIKANAAAYLQHLVYMDDPIKQKTRSLGGIPPLVELLNHEISEIHRNACGALRNLSYGRQNDENKKAIKNANGIPALVRLLRKTPDNEVRELVTAILWNLSSCEDLKKPIIDDGLTVLVNNVIIPHSGWDRNLDTDEVRPTDVYWSTVFRNASGILRNVSSAGDYARKKLRECEGLVDALLHLIKAAIGKNDIDNKSVENCVCILRNLSYRCQEVEDPDYDKHVPQPNRAGAPKKGIGDNTGCFGGSKKKKEPQPTDKRKSENNTSTSARPRSEPAKGMELLWQPEVVKPYLALLSDCSNPETLEASAGAIQNLAACYWQPSVDIRAAVRKEKGLPILVELLRMEVDRVVCAVATALRNLAIDQRNKELIGKYAMRDLTQKLPSGNQAMDAGTSDETIAAVLATLNEVIRKTPEFARSLLDSSGIDRLIFITKSKGKYSAKVAKFASQTLYNLWQHQELREAYKKAGYKEQQFVSPSLQARSPPTSANNTLNRPISSQGGTKYEDRTMPRSDRGGYDGKSGEKYREEIPMSDFDYGDGQKAAASPSQTEPVYAQVNRDRKNKRPDDHQRSLNLDSNNQAGGDSWV